ncbi:hypothetical protein [Paludisphaera soli]|uniref:hypothetical protein n=1 Tax=Paludisphaera soli TaxID=2712865 RepID=UPI0013ED2DCA|nr:hypothetical protein [Paludisphaera soli]
MNDAPESIDGAKVVLFALIDQRCRHTGNCRQEVAGVAQGPAAGLAICQYGEEAGCYLLGCDAAWHCVTDTWHRTVDEAISQAEFEYEGVREAWRRNA